VLQYHIESGDLTRLSPLVFHHINLLGRYSFSLPDSIQRGHLRPLRNPSEATEEATTKTLIIRRFLFHCSPTPYLAEAYASRREGEAGLSRHERLLCADCHYGRADELFALAQREAWRLVTTNAVIFETHAPFTS
jgi:hypothetical protein